MTPIVFAFPDWFYGVLSLTFLAGVWFVARQSKTFSEVCKEFPKMRRALDLMSESLFSNKMLSEKVYVSSASPLRLTDAGKSLLVNSGFEEFFTANKEGLFAEIDRMDPNTPFDVEAASRHVLLLHVDLKEYPHAERLKGFSYNNGIPISDILFAYSIEVRDRYLLERHTPVPA